MKTLFLPLKKEWYEMIERGEKTEEYRELTQYWMRRLCADSRNKTICAYAGPTCTARFSCVQCASEDGFRFIHYDAVCFSYGYTKRRMTFKCEDITIGKGRPEWGAPDYETFIIKLGNKL